MSKYQIITYDHRSGADEKQEYENQKDARKAAAAYRKDGYEGVCIYNLKARKITALYGFFPTASMPVEC